MNNIHTTIPSLAIKALMYEVSLSPKPGLVDRFNNGSHTDMDFYTFIESVFSFTPYFKEYYERGRELYPTDDVTELFLASRQIGIEAETAMFKATKGINTHKGANFSFALLLISIGYLIERDQLTTWTPTHTAEVFDLIREMTKDILLKDFEQLDGKKNLSHGEKLYLKHGITGIRGEAVSGYPILQHILMPYLRSADEPLTEYSLLKALLLVMGHIEDGNIIHRGGFEAWETVKMEALALYNNDEDVETFLTAMHDYDALLIERHLSPGGAADALGLGIFLYLLENWS